MTTVHETLSRALPGPSGEGRLIDGDSAADDYAGDECLTVEGVSPGAVIIARDTAEVSAILRVADDNGIPVTGRGAGTGLSGAVVPTEDSLLVSFEAMNSIIEIDTENHVAVVQPGIRLNELDDAIAEHGLVYPVYPGEYSASLGGNVNTNAGGMRAIKYGVTRHHVLGVEFVLPGGEVIRTGGKFVKATSGYDLTQLIVGSEGTLGLVTEITLKLHPRMAHQATVMAPFATLDEVTAAVPRIVDSGVNPLILEYIDMMTMAAAESYVGLELGIPSEVKETALAYLVVMLESNDSDRLDEDTEALGIQLAELGAMDVYVLPPAAAESVIDAREKAFWMSKANNADDIVDIVVPRARVPEYMNRVSAVANEYEVWIAGCGHAGDGNVHLGVFCGGDSTKRDRVMHELFDAGTAMGGAISAEHGIGLAKREHFLALEDPTKVALMRRIKTAFDPNGIMNPDKIF
ncbi:MAG: FAD-binding oxidoreductase [Microthrixaceae bacterium]